MIEQGSPEWFAARVGKLTASRMADAMAKIKTGYGASRANLMAEIVVERWAERMLIAGADDIARMSRVSGMSLAERMDRIASVLARVEAQRKGPGTRVPLLRLAGLREALLQIAGSRGAQQQLDGHDSCE